jgi:hypothetical protein
VEILELRRVALRRWGIRLAASTIDLPVRVPSPGIGVGRSDAFGRVGGGIDKPTAARDADLRAGLARDRRAAAG